MDIVNVLDALTIVNVGKNMIETRLKIVKGEYDVELHTHIEGKDVIIAICPDSVEQFCACLLHVRDQLIPNLE